MSARDTFLADLKHVSTGACPGCKVCGMPESSEDYDTFCEPHFSWRPCVCCGSTLGGDREPAHGVTPEGTIEHFECCIDCVLAINGVSK